MKKIQQSHLHQGIGLFFVIDPQYDLCIIGKKENQENMIKGRWGPIVCYWMYEFCCELVQERKKEEGYREQVSYIEGIESFQNNLDLARPGETSLSNVGNLFKLKELKVFFCFQFVYLPRVNHIGIIAYRSWAITKNNTQRVDTMEIAMGTMHDEFSIIEEETQKCLDDQTGQLGFMRNRLETL